MKIKIMDNVNYDEKNIAENIWEVELIQYKLDLIKKKITFTISTSEAIPIMERWFNLKDLAKTIIIEDDNGNHRIFKNVKPENKPLPLIGVNNIICSYISEVNY